jgi:hypothetical protein
MGMISSIRPALPAAEAHPSSAHPSPRPANGGAGAAPPVAATALVGAVQQPTMKTGPGEAQLLAARMTADTSAARAAEAAREAYIKASIAAGLNPLPLS